jgi:cytochrome P450
VTGHLAFGHGIHFCLGAHLARTETEIALRKLLERFRSWELAAEPDDIKWRSSVLIHGVDRLPVRLS